MATALYNCPFCAFGDDDSQFLVQHVGLVHPETDVSPFIVREHGRAKRNSVMSIEEESAGSRGATSGDGYIECECGETVLVSEFASHSDFHMAEGMALKEAEEMDLGADTTILSRDNSLVAETGSRTSNSPLHNSSPPRSRSGPSSAPNLPSRSPVQKHPYSIKDWVNVLLGSTPPLRPKTAATRKRKNARRLGKSDLGPHAFEDEMPAWLRRQLEQGAKVTVVNRLNADGRIVRLEQIANETRGILPVLYQLCEQDRSLSKVYLCHPDVQHVVKMAKEGGFCGYRNIQMMVSFIQDAKAEGHEHFPGRIPSILQLQDLIERAWDLGFNSCGRIETGGIRGTRKFIGTPEAQALLQSLDIGCEATAFGSNRKGNKGSTAPLALELIYQSVEDYFIGGTTDPSQKVCRTSLPPLYFQHPGHSLTIVGFEKRKSGTCNLLVFDPMFKPSPGIINLTGTRFRSAAPEKLLKSYRRGEGYLGRHKCFEILKLTSRSPPIPGWNG